VCAGSTLLLAKQSLDEAPYKLSGAVAKLASITFSRIVCSSPDRLNLGFLLREKTCRCAHHTFRLEFPNCLAIIIINYTPAIKPFFWRCCRGRSGRPLQGEFFARTSFTLFYCFALLYLFLLALLYQKPKKN
jgi:hypothetical protein